MTAAEYYAARVDAVLAQRAPLRGAEPSGDPFGNLDPDHPLFKADPHRALDANLEALADLIEPSDTIVDVGGGAGRMSLPLVGTLQPQDRAGYCCGGFWRVAFPEEAPSMQGLCP